MFIPSKKVVIDTGFMVALFNTEDEWHVQAKKAAERCSHLEWHTTSFVIQEIFWLLSKRKGFGIARTFIYKTESLLMLPLLPRDWLAQIANILKRYVSADIDLADASLVVLADYLKTGQVLSVDRKDFSILKWNEGKNPFHNLIEE